VDEAVQVGGGGLVLNSGTSLAEAGAPPVLKAGWGGFLVLSVEVEAGDLVLKSGAVLKSAEAEEGEGLVLKPGELGGALGAGPAPERVLKWGPKVVLKAVLMEVVRGALTL
jgi:hypothetical protein